MGRLRSRSLSGTISDWEWIYDHRQNGKGNSWPGRFILRLGLTRFPPTSRGDIRAEVRARLGSRMLEFLSLEPAPWLLAPTGRASQVSQVGSSSGLRPGSRDGGAAGSGSLSAKVG